MANYELVEGDHAVVGEYVSGRRSGKSRRSGSSSSGSSRTSRRRRRSSGSVSLKANTEKGRQRGKDRGREARETEKVVVVEVGEGGWLAARTPAATDGPAALM